MNNVDKYSAFITPQLPYNPSIGVIYSNHVDRLIEYNIPPLKRTRNPPLSFLGDDFSSLILQQTQDVDSLILNHAEKVRMELLDHYRRYWRQALALVEEGISKQLRDKDNEIERILKLNLALDERIKVLRLDSKIARIIAQTNVTEVMGLQNNLQQLLAVQEMRCEEARAAEDAESCGGYEEEQQPADSLDVARKMCRNCREGESSVCCCRAGICVSAAPVGRW